MSYANRLEQAPVVVVVVVVVVVEARPRVVVAARVGASITREAIILLSSPCIRPSPALAAHAALSAVPSPHVMSLIVRMLSFCAAVLVAPSRSACCGDPSPLGAASRIGAFFTWESIAWSHRRTRPSLALTVLCHGSAVPGPCIVIARRAASIGVFCASRRGSNTASLDLDAAPRLLARRGPVAPRTVAMETPALDLTILTFRGSLPDRFRLFGMVDEDAAAGAGDGMLRDLAAASDRPLGDPLLDRRWTSINKSGRPLWAKGAFILLDVKIMQAAKTLLNDLDFPMDCRYVVLETRLVDKARTAFETNLSLGEDDREKNRLRGLLNKITVLTLNQESQEELLVTSLTFAHATLANDLANDLESVDSSDSADDSDVAPLPARLTPEQAQAMHRAIEGLGRLLPRSPDQGEAPRSLLPATPAASSSSARSPPCDTWAAASWASTWAAASWASTSSTASWSSSRWGWWSSWSEPDGAWWADP